MCIYLCTHACLRVHGHVSTSQWSWELSHVSSSGPTPQPPTSIPPPHTFFQGGSLTGLELSMWLRLVCSKSPGSSCFFLLLLVHSTSHLAWHSYQVLRLKLTRKALYRPYHPHPWISPSLPRIFCFNPYSSTQKSHQKPGCLTGISYFIWQNVIVRKKSFQFYNDLLYVFSIYYKE